MTYLEEQSSEKKKKKSKQKQILQCEVDQLKLHKNSLQDLCRSFNAEFLKLMEEAEKKMDLFSKGNALKWKSEEKGKGIDDLNKAIAILEQK